MIAVDTNILVYAHRTELIPHDKAHAVVRSLAESPAPWAIPWPCVHEFLGVVTNRRVHALPTPIGLAFKQIERWSGSVNFRFIGEGIDHLDVLQDVCNMSSVSGGMIHDARIAAICIDHGVSELWSADRDFSRYPKLKVRNPLVV